MVDIYEDCNYDHFDDYDTTDSRIVNRSEKKTKPTIKILPVSPLVKLKTKNVPKEKKIPSTIIPTVIPTVLPTAVLPTAVLPKIEEEIKDNWDDD